MKKMYHATKFEDLIDIVENGIQLGFDNYIYLCDDPKDAAKFVAIRGYKNILVCEVEVDEKKLKESFDHSEEFFGCRAWTYDEPIVNEEITDYLQFNLD